MGDPINNHSMTKFTLFRILSMIVLCIIISCATIEKQPKVNIIENTKIGLWDKNKTKTITLKHELTIFNESNQNNIFSYVSGIKTDSNGNIYFTQYKTFTIHKFDKNGTFIMNIGREGQGPGEFIGRPNFFIHNDSLYVYDYGLKRCSIFTVNGIYSKSFRLSGKKPTNPSWGLQIDNNMNWYHSYYDRQINMVNHVYAQDGNYIKSFGEPQNIKFKSPENSYIFLQNFGKGQLVINGDYIYYSQDTPYEIRVYNLNGSIETIIHKENDLVPGQLEEGKENSIKLRAPSTSNMITIWNNMIINASRRLSGYESEYNSYLDFFDMKGNLLTSIKFKEMISFQHIDNDGNIFCIHKGEVSEKIVKYSIVIKN